MTTLAAMDLRDVIVAVLLAVAAAATSAGVWLQFGLPWALITFGLALAAIAAMVNGIEHAVDVPDEYGEEQAMDGEPADEATVVMRAPFTGPQRPARRSVGDR